MSWPGDEKETAACVRRSAARIDPFGRNLHLFAEVGSTSDEIVRLADQAKHLAAVSGVLTGATHAQGAVLQELVDEHGVVRVGQVSDPPVFLGLAPPVAVLPVLAHPGQVLGQGLGRLAMNS